MIVEQFLKWVESARASEREAAASALARAYLQSPLEFDERCAAEAALTVLLDDPSPNVRFALAEALSTSTLAPIQIVTALACDQPQVASVILVRSPLMGDTDLIDRVALGGDEVQCAVAMRAQLSFSLCAAIAEVACVEACQMILSNAGANIAGLSLRRLVERFGHIAEMRGLLLADPRLPTDARHALVVKLGEALRDMPMVMALMGKARAQRITGEACVRACLDSIDTSPVLEHPALVEHLRLRGELTTSFVLRVLINGKIGFFATIVSTLSGQAGDRIKAQLANGRQAILTSLFRQCGFTDSVAGVLMLGLETWRSIANGKLTAGPQEVSRIMLERYDAASSTPAFAHGNDDLVALLRSVYLETVRENGRKHALRLQAA